MVPFAAGIRRTQRAHARVRSTVAKRLIETANGVVVVRNGKQVVGRPAIVKAMRPYADHAALGHLLDLVICHLLPFADHDWIKPSVVWPGAGHDVEILDLFLLV